MKHIRSALAAGLLVIGGAAVASAQQSNGAVADSAHKAHAHAQGGMRGARGAGRDGAFLRGIQLTDAEKASIKNVHAKYAGQFKALRGDKAAKGQKPTTEQRAKVRQLMTQERAEIRSALTTQHVAAFDANVARMEQRFAKRGGKPQGNGTEKGKVLPRTPGQTPRA